MLYKIPIKLLLNCLKSSTESARWMKIHLGNRCILNMPTIATQASSSHQVKICCDNIMKSFRSKQQLFFHKSTDISQTPWSHLSNEIRCELLFTPSAVSSCCFCGAAETHRSTLSTSRLPTLQGDTKRSMSPDDEMPAEITHNLKTH